MKCHEVDFQIIGHDMPMVEVELDPSEAVVAEAGAMNYMEDGISFDTKIGDGSDADQGVIGKLFSAGRVGSHDRWQLILREIAAMLGAWQRAYTQSSHSHVMVVAAGLSVAQQLDLLISPMREHHVRKQLC
jgi:uncharacterized protein (AIM24 family)